ncbi:MAG: hypothetical protein AAF984_02960 [Verrucomicrobiota bacterium]
MDCFETPQTVRRGKFDHLNCMPRFLSELKTMPIELLCVLKLLQGIAAKANGKSHGTPIDQHHRCDGPDANW